MSETTDMIQALCDEIGITATVSKDQSNRNMPDFEGDHWKVTLKNKKNGKRMTTPFSKGYGHHGAPPDVVEVIATLCMDSYYTDMTFDEFCDELGYDNDSRKAHQSYLNTIRQGKKFEEFLGEDLEEMREVCQDY